MEALLDPTVSRLLDAERDVLTRLQELLRRADTDAETVAQIGDLIQNLEALFLVVIVGEFNAGKSSVVNALFGEQVMEEGPIPTTAKITVLRHGEERLERQLTDYLVERRVPSDLLRYLNLVDTPGTNSIIREHQRITEDFIPRADLVLFITSFDRPLTESERQFLEFIRGAWGKRLVFVVNKADLARTDDALRQVIGHVKSGCQDLMGFEPRIFPVSAELAYASKTAEKESVAETLWQQSLFAPFETYITETLTGPEQLSLKLQAPLETAATLLGHLGTRLDARTQVLEQDEQNLGELETRLSAAEAELKDGYQRTLAEIDNLLLQVEKRGEQFLNDTLRVSRLDLLRDKDRFKDEFQRQVLRDTDRQIEDYITEAVDRLLKQALALWNRTVNDFAERVRAAGRDAYGPAQRDFLYNRQEVFQAIMKEAERKTQTHNLREEARRIIENAAQSADLVQYTGAGAAGLGLLSGVLLVATALDAVGGFGLITAGAVGVMAFTILPMQRRKAIRELNERIDGLRDDMRKALDTQLGHEVTATLDKIRASLRPYTDFVHQERADLDAARTEHAALQGEVTDLRAQVKRDVGEAAA